MTCHHVPLASGGHAIICTSEKAKRCIQCGRRAALLCDWKVKARRSGTCDAPICTSCTHSPAPEKDLCPSHAAEWMARS
jgi:hypothetical protein